MLIRQARGSGCGLVSWEVDIFPFGNNPVAGFLKSTATSFSRHESRRTTAFLVFG